MTLQRRSQWQAGLPIRHHELLVPLFLGAELLLVVRLFLNHVLAPRARNVVSQQVALPVPFMPCVPLQPPLDCCPIRAPVSVGLSCFLCLFHRMGSMLGKGCSFCTLISAHYNHRISQLYKMKLWNVIDCPPGRGDVAEIDEVRIHWTPAWGES